jgi:hypothetical protein
MSRGNPLTHTEISNILVYLIMMPIILSIVLISVYYQYIMVSTDYIGPWILFIASYIISGAIFYFVETKKLSK